MINLRRPNLFGSFLIVVVIGAATDYRKGVDELRIDHYIMYGLIAIGVLMSLKFFKIVIKFARRQKHTVLSNIDSMDGIKFESYVAALLKKQGYTNVRLTEKYDLGIDIIAVKNGERWGIQVKRRNSLVKADAVRQVVTAMNYYRCVRSMVVTNSYLSRTALQLASSNMCTVVDRHTLEQWACDIKR